MPLPDLELVAEPPGQQDGADEREEAADAPAPELDPVALGRVGGTVTDGCENGEVLLTNGGGSVKIKNSGEIILSGDIALTGTVKINGTLLINGQAYVPPASAATGA